MMKRKYKKLQIDKYGRVLCAVLLTVYFIFALTQSNAFKGEMFNALKVQHEKNESIHKGWEKSVDFKADYADLQRLEMSIINPRGSAAEGTMRFWITDQGKKVMWQEDVPMSRLAEAKFHKGIRGTVITIKKQLQKGNDYTLHLRVLEGSESQGITLKSKNITIYYNGFNVKKYVMLLASVLALFILIFIPNRLNEKWNLWLSRGMFLITPVFCYVLMERFTSVSLKYIGIKYGLLNLLIYAAVLAFFYLITNRTRWASILSILCTSGLGIANYYVTSFRGTSLMPVDFATIGTAANVATQYEYDVNTAVLWNGVLILAFVILAVRLQCGKGIRGKKRFVPAAVFGVLLAVCVSVFGSTARLSRLGIHIKVWNPTVSCNKYGYMNVFTSSVKFLITEKPEGYSAEKVDEIMKPYVEKAEKHNQKAAGKKPNVITIMNEAFSDLSVLGDIKTNKDFMPFIRGLKENSVKGTMYMSSYGGQTANSEFEFLTGSSMAFLPGGSVAYQYQVKDTMGSLATTMEGQGYQGNMVLHPYLSNGYNREKVYPLLGFKDYLSIGDFQNPEVCRSFITDQEDFNKITSEYEKAKQKSSAPFFMFNVTIQNHGGYEKDYSNFNQEIKITDTSSNPSANRYLSLIKKTDDAFKNLISYFKKVKEPTVIVMFGDHQPKLPQEFYNKVMDKENGSALENEQKKHQVPFIIWANYDIKEEEIKAISPNYLSAKLLKVIGGKMTPYECFLQDLYTKYPVVTGSVYMDKKYNLFNIDNLDDLPEDLKQYWMVQYYHLFAKDKRDDSLFFLKE